MGPEKTGGPAGPALGPEGASKVVPLLALDSESLVLWFSEVLASRAWVDVGLLADPLSGEVVKNLDSARVAIDAFEGLIKVLRARLGADGVGRLEGMLAELRLNYVRQAGSA